VSLWLVKNKNYKNKEKKNIKFKNNFFFFYKKRKKERKRIKIEGWLSYSHFALSWSYGRPGVLEPFPWTLEVVAPLPPSQTSHMK
jgi:hypothetical protein